MKRPRSQHKVGKHCWLALILCFPVAAVDESRLWLPLSYQTLYLQLKQAAENVEGLDRCVEILDGTVDLQQSKKDHPLFRFRCRQANGRTYSEMVDGLSLETLTTLTPKVVELTEEEKEQLRLEEEKRKLEEKEARIIRMRALCQTHTDEKTRLMMNKEYLPVQPKAEVLNEAQLVFFIDFDAEGASGEELKFQAQCEVHGQEIVSFELGKRPETGKVINNTQ